MVGRREAGLSSSAIKTLPGFLSSTQPSICQIARKSSMSLISGVPVSAIISGRAHALRMRSETSRTFCDRWDFLFLM